MALPDALLRAAFEQSAEPLAVASRLGVPVMWNAAFSALLRTVPGAGPDPSTVSLFELFSQGGKARFGYYAAELLIGARKSAAFEGSLAAPDGSERHLAFVLSLLEARSAQAPVSGEVERYLLVSAVDVTERVLRERRLADAKEEAEKATHTKSQFLANMSHEIRTPIQTILGVVELLQGTKLDTEQSEYSGQVRFSAEVLLSLINDILDFSKIEAGKLDLEDGTFDLRAAVRQSVNMLVLEAHKKGLEVVVDIGPELPALVRGDAGRIRQIIVNLFKNAVKFTNEGSVSLSVAPVESATGRRLRFEVADTGPGVSDEMRDKLFTPFFQGDFAQARKAGGTGLGLAISRHLVEIMGGDIGLARKAPRSGDSAGGPGSRFWFEIPLVSPDYSAPPRTPAARGSRVAAPGAKLLVVDDHPLARAFAARAATQAGYRVSTAASGDDALSTLRGAAAEGEPFSLCLIDQNMPRMDGWRLASEITGDTAINGARLILMAPVGTIGADAKMKLLRWFNGYISKPVVPGDMLDALERALSSDVDLEAADSGAEAVVEEAERVYDCDVLIAEDHEVNRELFTVLLQKLGCRVAAARDGAEAVEVGSSRAFDIVLMDIFMPRMNGYEATKALREAGYRGPIIAVTASALKGEREKCIASGMDDILVKPFKKKDLSDVLAAHLGASAGGDLPAPGAERAMRGAAMGDREPNAAKIPVGSPAEAVPAGAPSAAGDAAATVPDTEVFDWEGVLETFLGQKETVVGLLKRFVDKGRDQEAQLRAALEARDMQAFREIAHSLKGASWNLSARRLGDAALAAETAGREGDEAAAKTAHEKVSTALAEFAAAVLPYVG